MTSKSLGKRVSEQEMISAYRALSSTGEKPTAARLFRALGRGSYYTCTKFLEKTEAENRLAISGQQVMSCGNESPYFVGTGFSPEGKVSLLLPDIVVMLDANQISSLLAQDAEQLDFVEIPGATVRLKLARSGAMVLKDQLRSLTALLNGVGRSE